MNVIQLMPLFLYCNWSEEK